MEERRVALAIFLSLLVILIYMQFFGPVAPTLPKNVDQTAVLATPTGATLQSSTSPPTTASLTTKSAEQISVPSLAELQGSPSIIVENSRSKVTLASLGGRIRSLVLKDYLRHVNEKEPLDMVIPEEGGTVPGGVYWRDGNDTHIRYSFVLPSGVSANEAGIIVIPENAEIPIKMVGRDEKGVTIEKTFTFIPGSFVIRVEIAREADAPGLRFDWSHFYSKQELENKGQHREFVALLSSGRIERTTLDDKFTNSVSIVEPASWSAIADTYFLTALVPSDPGATSEFSRSGNDFSVKLSTSSKRLALSLFAGPKDLNSLQATSLQLERSIDMGWFTVLAVPLLSSLRFFNSIFGNYGLAIILLTLLLKLLFLPLTTTSVKSAKAMQELQPEISALKERIKDSMQLNQEVMALYKRRGVNPMSGCFPVIIQIPVFIGLYNALSNAFELRHAPFALWVHDLSVPDAIHVFGYAVPVLVLIMGVTMYLQQKTFPPPADPQQQKILKFMPLVMTFLFMSMPAGLVLYWIVNNCMSIIQQVCLRNDTALSALQATILASLGIFGFSFVLTLL